MCHLCEIKSVYEFTNQRKLCKTCFIRWFQKKVLYSIRRFEMINSGEVVGYKNVEDFRGVVLEDVLKMFVEKSIVELVPQAYTKEAREPANAGPEKSFAKIFTKGMRLPTRKRVNKIAIVSSTDLEADKIVHTLINGKNKLNFPKEGKNIYPLYLFLDKEILLYAKLRNLKFRKIKKSTQGCTPKNIQKNIVTKGNKISEFINEMEKTHPEIKQAIVNSYLGS